MAKNGNNRNKPQQQGKNTMNDNTQDNSGTEITPAQPVDSGVTLIQRDGCTSVVDSAGNPVPLMSLSNTSNDIGLSTAIVNALSTADVVALTTEDIAGLASGEITALSTTILPALSTNDLATLGTSDISALSTEQLASLNAVATAALTGTSLPTETAAKDQSFPDGAPASNDPPPADAQAPAQAPVTSAAAEPEPVAEVQQIAPSVLTPVAPTALVDLLPMGASAVSKIVINELENYIAEATVALTKRITDERGAAMQSSLYRALKGAVNAPEAEFAHVMNITLAAIHEHRDTVFHATKVMHFMPHLNLAPAHINSFRKLVNMFTAMADKEGRGLAKKQVNFEASLEHKDITEQARQRVMAFFNV